MWPMLASLIPGALKGIWNLGSQWLENRRKISEAKGDLEAQKVTLSSQLEIARLQATVAKTEQDGAWENVQATNSNSSWKDEFWTLILALPMVLVTISPLVDMVMDPEPYQKGALITAAQTSLEAFNGFPDWYVLLISVAVGAAFGVRIWDRFRSERGRLVVASGNNGRGDSQPAPVRDAIEQKIDK